MATEEPEGEENERKAEVPRFALHLHRAFFRNFYKITPSFYDGLDSTSVVVVFFTVSGMLLSGNGVKDNEREAVIAWLRNLYLHGDHVTGENCGFRGGPSLGVRFRDPSEGAPANEHKYSRSHIAMTLQSLNTLMALGDDLSGIDTKRIVKGLRFHQQKCGNFSSILHGSESDMRYVYAACAISALLDDWTGFDLDLTTQYILDSQAYDGGFGMRPGAEGHGGSTFCAVASLYLMDRLDRIDRPALLRWLVHRQGEGWAGRPNKPSDTCYSFWLGATARLTRAERFTTPASNRKFNLCCQSGFGGFKKVPEHMGPDILHSYFGLCGMSLFEQLDGLYPSLSKVHVAIAAPYTHKVLFDDNKEKHWHPMNSFG